MDVAGLTYSVIAAEATTDHLVDQPVSLRPRDRSNWSHNRRQFIGLKRQLPILLLYRVRRI